MEGVYPECLSRSSTFSSSSRTFYSSTGGSSTKFSDDTSSAFSEFDETEYYAFKLGEPGTASFRALFFRRRDGFLVSPWHDIPLYDKECLLRCVCTSPAAASLQHCFSAAEPHTPLCCRREEPDTASRHHWYTKGIQKVAPDVAGVAHYVSACPWNLGVLPQTLHSEEDMFDGHPELRGSGAPLEAIDISGRRAPVGSVFPIKPVAAFAVQSGPSSFSWKIVGVAGDSPLAGLMSKLSDVEEYFPGELQRVQEWLDMCCSSQASTPGFPAPLGPDDAHVAVAQANATWQLFVEENAPPEPVAAGYGPSWDLLTNVFGRQPWVLGCELAPGDLQPPAGDGQELEPSGACSGRRQPGGALQGIGKLLRSASAARGRSASSNPPSAAAPRHSKRPTPSKPPAVPQPPAIPAVPPAHVRFASSDSVRFESSHPDHVRFSSTDGVLDEVGVQLEQSTQSQRGPTQGESKPEQPRPFHRVSASVDLGRAMSSGTGTPPEHTRRKSDTAVESWGQLVFVDGSSPGNTAGATSCLLTGPAQYAISGCHNLAGSPGVSGCPNLKGNLVGSPGYSGSPGFAGSPVDYSSGSPVSRGEMLSPIRKPPNLSPLRVPGAAKSGILRNVSYSGATNSCCVAEYDPALDAGPPVPRARSASMPRSVAQTLGMRSFSAASSGARPAALADSFSRACSFGAREGVAHHEHHERPEPGCSSPPADASSAFLSSRPADASYAFAPNEPAVAAASSTFLPVEPAATAAPFAFLSSWPADAPSAFLQSEHEHAAADASSAFRFPRSRSAIVSREQDAELGADALGRSISVGRRVRFNEEVDLVLLGDEGEGDEAGLHAIPESLRAALHVSMPLAQDGEGRPLGSPRLYSMQQLCS